MTISVLLADDSEIMRKVIVDLLKSDPEIEVVAESVGFAQTIQLAAKLHPQVIVLAGCGKIVLGERFLPSVNRFVALSGAFSRC
jgi:two-component system chemotaxis response regulator CheB